MLDQYRYFLREALDSLRQQMSSNLVSWLCIGLSLFLVAGALVGWMQLQHLLGAVRAEADVALFIDDGMTEQQVEALLGQLNAQSGVIRTALIDEDEALLRMTELLGGEGRLLTAFEDFNPFSRFIEVTVIPESAAAVASRFGQAPGVWGVRANEEVLAGLVNLTLIVRWLGMGLGMLVGLICIVLVSHIVKLGIHLRYSEIRVLRLLGAKESFIAAPFFLEGVLIGALGGVLATGLATGCLVVVVGFLQRGIPFLPILAAADFFPALGIALIVFGAAAGAMGSLLGLRHLAN